MFWGGTAANREDAPSDESDFSDDWDVDYRRHSRDHHRDSRSSKNSSWLPTFGFLSAKSEKKSKPSSSSKKSRRKARRGKGLSCRPQTSRGWGLLLLFVLLFIYLLDFFHLLYRDKRGKSRMRTGTQRTVNPGYGRVHHVRHYPPPGHPAVGQQGPHSPKPPPAVPQPENPVTGGTASKALSPQIQDESPKKVDHPVPPPHAPPAKQTAEELKEVALAKALIAPANTGKLGIDQVKEHYRKLAQYYLQTFTGGIYRQLFFDVLRRRTYALTPPGANKGIQCILFQVIDKKVYMMDPYEVPRNSKPFYRTRINEVIWILSRLAEAGRIKNTEFLMAIHDCVQTVNKPHEYRGAHYQESNPTFTIVSCNFSNNIPFPMWEGSDRDGGFAEWDEYTKRYGSDTVPWESKKGAAVFRGSNRPSMYFKNKADAEQHCNDVGRTRLIYLSDKNPGLFDVSVGGHCGSDYHILRRLSAADHHKYKYIMYMEGNCMWADRLRQQVFGPSAIIKQETACRQFFEPLLGPWTHYIPTDFFLTNTVAQIGWARENDPATKRIVQNANEFANNFLSLAGIEAYVEVLLEEYTKLLVEPDIKLENGAIDITNKKV